MSSPNDQQTNSSGQRYWAARAAELKEQLIHSRQTRSASDQHNKMTLSSQSSDKQPKAQGGKAASNATTPSNNIMPASLSTELAKPGHNGFTDQHLTDKAAQRSSDITDELIAIMTGTSAPPNQGLSTSNSLQPPQVVAKCTRGNGTPRPDANARAPGPSNASQIKSSNGAIRTKPQNASTTVSTTVTEGKRDVQCVAAKDGKTEGDPKSLKPHTAAELQKKKGTSQQSTVPATARQGTPPSPTQTSSLDATTKPRPEKNNTKLTRPVQRHTSQQAKASQSSSTRDNNTRGRLLCSLPYHPRVPDANKATIHDDRDVQAHQPKPYARTPSDRARSESPRLRQPSTVSPRAHADDAIFDQDTPVNVPFLSCDLRDWLRFTGWNDRDYRERELERYRQRRLAEIEREKADLEEATALANRMRKVHKDTSNPAAAPPQTVDRGGRMIIRRTDNRIDGPTFGRSPRCTSGVKTPEFTMVGDYPVTSTIGVKRDRRGSEGDRGSPTKYYRADFRGHQRGAHHGRGYVHQQGSYHFDEREDRRRDNRPNRSPFRLGTPLPRRWSHSSKPAGQSYEHDDCMFEKSDIYRYGEREPTNPRGCGGDYASSGFRGGHGGGRIRRR
ncbi:hypothetical protein VP1G_00837 [Cytospora mali]|uniref:Uncharacterized protein n=1 Tax=Cytospora mali TaxID=578113 RepID=A0A194UP72_CYTMA|nr:hypothetical protein VP1G_00837 [Valsa mali var. pyri (nom. inval.)]